MNSGAPDLSSHRVVVADGHTGMRRALEAVLAVVPTLTVVAVVADMAAAGAALRHHRADALAVDSGLLVERRHDLGPLPAHLVVVALGMEHHAAATARAVAHGAHAYVVKDRAHAELAKALDAARH